MPEQIRALIVVLVVSTMVWILVRPAIVQIISPDTFARWRMLWYITTFAWFLAHSFWLYVLVIVVMLIVMGRREEHVFGLYLLLMLAAPPVATPIPGFGVVDHIFMLDHYRLLALALLAPTAWRLVQRSSTMRLFKSPVDWLVVGYLVLDSLLAYRGDSFTNNTRTALLLWLDLFLPYYVASRSIQNAEGFRHALVGLALGAVLVSALAAIEVLRSWKLYEAATSALGLTPYTHYKMRGGFLRPSATIIDSIVLGYVIVIAAGGYLYLHRLILSPMRRRLGWLALAIGLLASLSRGPWVGAVLLLVVFVLLSPRPFALLLKSATGFTIVLMSLSFVPGGHHIINLLPFVGQVEQENIDYRADLLTVSLPVIERNLLFGASDFLDAPELEVMRQGEGIIDIVNSYLGVALHSGLAGLLLFSGIFISALLALRRGMRWARQAADADAQALGRAIFATVVSIMFIIFTVSGMFIVPTLYFVIAGLSSAYFLIHLNSDREKRASAVT